MKIARRIACLIALALSLFLALSCSRTDRGGLNDWVTGKTISAKLAGGLTVCLRNSGADTARISPIALQISFAHGKVLRRTCVVTRSGVDQVQFKCGTASGAAMIQQANSQAQVSGDAKLLPGEEIAVTLAAAFEPEIGGDTAVSAVTIKLPNANQRFVLSSR
jgi:hypothetical protein